MIIFENLSNEEPYKVFEQKYKEATEANQNAIEAISISSFSKDTEEVHSRFVNLKLIKGKEFIFFSNYNSPKALQFLKHSQITALFYWSSTNTQIRMKANIEQTSTDFNNNYFKTRSPYKNALAISSRQSEPIDSYETVISNYEKSLKFDNLNNCPEYWGGFSFTPYYFEFWHGHESRINKRDIYEIKENIWSKSNIQP